MAKRLYTLVAASFQDIYFCYYSINKDVIRSHPRIAKVARDYLEAPDFVRDRADAYSARIGRNGRSCHTDATNYDLKNCFYIVYMYYVGKHAGPRKVVQEKTEDRKG